MIQIQGLDHVVLRTTRLAAMIDFYQRLGCHIEREETQLGLYQLRAGASLIDIVPVEAPLGQEGGPAPGQDGHNMDHFCLTLENFDGDAVLAYLDGQGIVHQGIQRRYGAQGYGPSIYIQDPEGNRVELKGPPETAAQT